MGAVIVPGGGRPAGADARAVTAGGVAGAGYADEQAIKLLPAGAWQAAVDQDGAVQNGRHAAEITHLMSRAAGWPQGLRWIVRRTRPSRRQLKKLTAFERATGWRYAIVCTNIPATGMAACPAATIPRNGGT
jgi:hypothetical protein